MTGKGESFTCDLCGDTCVSNWSEEEAQAEYEQNFGAYVSEEKGVLCDDCYQLFMRWFENNGKKHIQ